MSLNARITNVLVGILVITPLVIAPWTLDYFYFPKILMVYVLISIISILILLHSRKMQSSMEFKLPSFDISESLILIYLLWLVLSTAFSMDIERSIWGIYQREEGLLAITAYIYLFFVSKRYYTFSKVHIYLLTFTSIIISLYGIVQYLGYDPIPRDFIRMNWAGRAFSTMGNPNFLGSFLVLMLPIFSFAYIMKKYFLFLFASSVVYASLLVTFTRSAYLGGFFSIALLIFFSIKYLNSKKTLKILLFSFLVLTILINYQSSNRVLSSFTSISVDAHSLIMQTENQDSTGSDRGFIWKYSLDAVPKSPLLGHGLETLDLVFHEHYTDNMIDYFGFPINIDKAHNEYLHIAVSSGIPSLLLYLTFILFIMYRSLQRIPKNLLTIPLFCSVSGYLVQAFFNISVVSVAYVFWIFLGILLALSYPRNKLKNKYLLI